MIDWNKPLRFTTAKHIANPVFIGFTDGQGLAIVKYGLSRQGSKSEYYHVVRRDTGESVQGGYYNIENVPEEPKDHLHLYRSPFGGEWCVNVAGTAGPNQIAPRQLQPKSYWDKSRGGIVVKVPA